MGNEMLAEGMERDVMNGSLWVFVLGGAVLAFLWCVLWPRWKKHRGKANFEDARVRFHRQREWLEAHFLSLARKSGRFPGFEWAECEFDDGVAFARDRATGRLRALVSVSIQFETRGTGNAGDPDSEVYRPRDERREATVLFRLDGPQWETDGHVLMNLNPIETIARYEQELERVE